MAHGHVGLYERMPMIPWNDMQILIYSPGVISFMAFGEVAVSEMDLKRNVFSSGFRAEWVPMAFSKEKQANQ